MFLARRPGARRRVLVDGSIGVLLFNVGSPDAPTTSSVRRYLREFLSDPRVIDIPALGRWMLLNFVILPRRPRKSAAAYATVWTDRGSPLIEHSHALAQGLQRQLDQRRPGTFLVRVAMRYGSPSVGAVIDELQDQGVRRFLVLPMYPQYATSSFGSAVAAVYTDLAARWNTPAVEVLSPFFDEPGYLTVLAGSLSRSLANTEFDHLLFSFHGLPERQIRKSDDRGECLQAGCCDRRGAADSYCYRAQCYTTARLTAEAMGLSPDRWSVAFQSRLGRTPWIRPFTDERLIELGRGGLRLVTAAPSFTADCLETLEELAERGRRAFLEAGGREYLYLPCLNADPAWASYLCDRILARAALP